MLETTVRAEAFGYKPEERVVDVKAPKTEVTLKLAEEEWRKWIAPALVGGMGVLLLVMILSKILERLLGGKE